MLLRVFTDGAIRGKRGRQPGHTLADARHPFRGQVRGVAIIELRDDLTFQQGVERFGFGRIPRWVVAVLVAIADGPTHVWRKRFCPPAVELGEVQSAVHQHFHAAGAAGLPRSSRRIHPNVHAADQALGQEHIVVAQEDHARGRASPVNELAPLLDHRLAGSVLRVCFSGEDKLNGMLGIGKNAHQPFRIVQQKVRPLVRCKAPGKPEGQGVEIEHLPCGGDLAG